MSRQALNGHSACRSALARAGVEGGRLLVAVSGGLDSRVLLEMLLDLAPERDLEIIVGHIDHQLRGEASRADAQFVESVAAQLGLRFVQRKIDPEAARLDRSSRERPTLEEAARNLRRRAFFELADEQGARWIATAHHAGDQAETVLLRILRGTGPDGLAGMAEVSAGGRLIRPLLEVTPRFIRDFAEERNLIWREDASNQRRDFARNRLRLDEMPRLAEKFNSQLLRTLCNLAEAHRQDLDWIEGLVDEAAEGRVETKETHIELALDGWGVLPEALARRLARRALVEVGLEREITRTHLERVLAALRRGHLLGRDKVVELPCGIALRRVASRFELGPIRSAQVFATNEQPTDLMGQVDSFEAGRSDEASDSFVDEGIERPENATVLARD